ncbi:hypothetical protein LAZ67_8001017 [Cordylochernes scorpioides]|uniref:Uncharacterized protein n=1 Tax=Cordylochernes scorpioides TaxID=51811 RepID=A0ABY6KPX9_9ARAC|nr:hypothetical protein LAZ67_8001017 [Cordylochernes scorpioides]
MASSAIDVNNGSQYWTVKHAVGRAPQIGPKELKFSLEDVQWLTWGARPTACFTAKHLEEDGRLIHRNIGETLLREGRRRGYTDDLKQWTARHTYEEMKRMAEEVWRDHVAHSQ